jgi:hypothetical protein
MRRITGVVTEITGKFHENIVEIHRKLPRNASADDQFSFRISLPIYYINNEGVLKEGTTFAEIIESANVIIESV